MTVNCGSSLKPCDPDPKSKSVKYYVPPLRHQLINEIFFIVLIMIEVC